MKYKRRILLIFIMIGRFCLFSHAEGSSEFSTQSNIQKEPPLKIFPQTGHLSFINSGKISPDQLWAATCSMDGYIKLWDIKTGREIRAFQGHSKSVNDISFSPNGEFLISGSSDKTAKLWETQTGKIIFTFKGHKNKISSVNFSPDGQLIITTSWDETAKIWDVKTKKLILTIRGHSDDIRSAAFSPDGKYVITGSLDKTIKLWNIKDKKIIHTFKGHSAAIYSVAFSPDGEKIISASGDKTAKIWDIKTKNGIQTFHGHKGYLSSASFSPDGKFILTGSGDGKAKLWNVKSGKEIHTFLGHMDGILAASFGKEGNYIITGSSDNTAKIWDIKTGQNIQTFQGYADQIKFIKFNPQNNVTAIILQDGTINIRNLNDNYNIRTLKGYKKNVSTAAFSQDGNFFIICYYDKTIKLWDLKTSKEFNFLNNQLNVINTVVFSYNNQYIFTGSNNSGKIWDIKTGKEIQIMEGHSGLILSASFSPDNQYIITGSSDKTAKLWNIKTGQSIRTFKGHSGSIRAISFCSTKQQFVTASGDKTAKLWNINTGEEIHSYYGHINDIISIDINKNDNYMITGSIDRTAKLWDMQTGKAIHNFTGHSGSINAFFSSDGKNVFTNSKDNSVCTWNMKSGKLLNSNFSFNDGEWISITSEGYFNASKNGAKYLNVKVGNKVYGINQFFNTFYRPDIVKAKIAGLDISKYTNGINLGNSFTTPPLVKLDFECNDNVYRDSFISVNQLKITNGEIKIRVSVTDLGGGAEDIRLFHNGRRISSGSRGLKVIPSPESKTKLTAIFSIALTDGNNLFKATAFTTSKMESVPETAQISYKAVKQNTPSLWIMAVGINEYRNNKYNLRYAVDDAQAFINTVKSAGRGLFKNINEVVLYNENSNLSNISKAFSDIYNQSKPEDVFVFFYAGHGITAGKDADFYMVLPEVTQMTDEKLLKTKGLSGAAFETLITGIPANKQLLIIDACNSGALRKSFGFRGASEEIALARLSRATGSALIAASLSSQRALESTELGQGVLTYALLEGLNGKAALSNREITVTSLKTYVESRLPQITKKFTGQEQWPTGFVSGQDFPIGLK